MRTYDVILSYPIKVRAEDETHVKEIIMNSEHLGDVSNLTLKIKEIKDEKRWWIYNSKKYR